MFVPILDNGTPPPEYKTKFAAGCDLAASAACTLPPHTTIKVPTGVFIEIPAGYFGMVRERSSLAIIGITCPGGIIDADYRGECFVNLRNNTDKPYIVDAGARLANLIFIPFMHATFIPVKELSTTVRGEGGYGSTNSVR